jgi:hypothetical protein
MGFADHCVYLTFHSHMISEIRQYPKVTATAIISCPSERTGPGTNEPDRAENELVGGPGVSSPLPSGRKM